MEHLEELRARALRSLAALALATAVSFPFSARIIQLLKYPAGGSIGPLVFFGPEEAFTVYMRVSFSAGILIALPVILFQVWAFFSPAIDDGFKKHAGWFVVFSSLAFLAGCLFSYFILIPAALKFLLNIGKGELEPVISATRYIGFVTAFALACGLVFEMPVAGFFLTRIGLVNARFLRSKFLTALIGIMVVSAVITPTGDVFNMFLLALPMILLYEATIWVSFFSGRRSRR